MMMKFVALVIAAVAIYMQYGGIRRSSSNIWQLWDDNDVNFIVRGIKTLRLTPKNAQEFKYLIYNEYEPVLIHNSSLLTSDVKQWTPSWLSAHIHDNLSVYAGSDNNHEFLYYQPSKPLKQLKDIDEASKPAYKRENMSINTFFNECYKRPLYYSGIDPFRPVIDEIGRIGEEISKTFTMHVWMGCDGSFSSAHTDDVRNLYLQVYGRKRFILFPPNSYRSLYPYSSLHPNARQTQLDFMNLHTHTTQDSFPLFYNGGVSDASRDNNVTTELVGIDVILEAGDTLYIPPYWYHYVESNDNETSISVSLWIDSDDAIALKNVGLLTVPAPTSCLDDQIASYAYYVKLLLIGGHRILSSSSSYDGLTIPYEPHELLAHLINVRFHYMNANTNKMKFVGMSEFSDCDSIVKTHPSLALELKQVATQAIGLLARYDDKTLWNHRMTTKHIRKYYTSIFENLLLNYVEAFVLASVGNSVYKVYPFIRQIQRVCFL